jgi:hypothetical protein
MNFLRGDVGKMDNKNRFKLDSDESVETPKEQTSEQPKASASPMEPPPHGPGRVGHVDGDEDYNSGERFDNDKVRLVDFLQYPREKRKLKEFLEETYKSYEEENVDRTIHRVVHEHESELQGSTEFYKPGHIGPLMYEYLNMIGVESAFVSGLQHTKSSMTKTVQQRVDEINTLLRGLGGFNRQIKASFSRSAVVYLEQEDPNHKHRETVVFTINLGDFELRYPLDESADEEMVADGRTLRRLVWDEAVNTLAEIVSNTGLKPKYVKNDKNSCVFTMRQMLLSGDERQPDEFFTFDLRHVNEAHREKLIQEYTAQLSKFDAELAEIQKHLGGWFVTRSRRAALNERILHLQKERDFYIGTHPDPREMDMGLVFSIHVNTLKDYGVTKDKMQVIMTKYILALSKIAVDKSMDQQVNTVYQRGQAKPQDFQNLETAQSSETGDKRVMVMKEDLVRKKKAAGSRFRP